MVTPGELESLRTKYKVPCIVNLVVSLPNEGAVDSGGLASKVTLYPAMFSNGLRLTFFRPVHDVLDFVGMTHTQLYPNV